MSYSFAVTITFFYIKMEQNITTEIISRLRVVGFMRETIKWPQNVVKLPLDT